MISKERLIDEMITQISDTIIYVVKEVLNEDQKTILHVGKISRRWGRSSCWYMISKALIQKMAKIFSKSHSVSYNREISGLESAYPI
jgi:hypothetical protein